jgi:hypothetical protein
MTGGTMSFLKRTTLFAALVVSIFTGAKQMLSSVNSITQSHIAALDPNGGGTTG